jgi:uncharacterized protein (DUF4415 family)
VSKKHTALILKKMPKFEKNLKTSHGAIAKTARSNKRLITLDLDTDVLAWFKEQGKGYQTHINAVLKAYKDAHDDS